MCVARLLKRHVERATGERIRTAAESAAIARGVQFPLHRADWSVNWKLNSSAFHIWERTPIATISPYLHGMFAEHLGGCIYPGIWVGEDSSIPNTRGLRNDVTEALPARPSVTVTERTARLY